MKALDKIFLQLPKSKYLQLLPDFKNERTQKFTTIILTLMALSFFGLFAINPTFSTITELKKELSDNKFVDQQLKQKIANLNSLQQKYSSIQKDIPVILDAIPTKPDIPLLLGQIQSVAIANNIDIKNLQNFQINLFNNQNTDSQEYSYYFSLSGEGSPENISSFMTSLITMQRIISIETFSVGKNEDQSGPSQFTLKGVAYYKIQ